MDTGAVLATTLAAVFILMSGLWLLSLVTHDVSIVDIFHPNYFGDALAWWGLYIIAAATPPGAWTVLSPLVMTVLLMRVSGVALLERKLKKTRPEYAAYCRRVNAFVPWFPRHA